MIDTGHRAMPWHDWAEAPLAVIGRRGIAGALGVETDHPALTDILARSRFVQRIVDAVRAYHDLEPLISIGPIGHADMPVVSLRPNQGRELIRYVGALHHAGTIAARIEARSVESIRSAIGEGAWRLALAGRRGRTDPPDRDIDAPSLQARIDEDGYRYVHYWFATLPDALKSWLRLGLFDGIDLDTPVSDSLSHPATLAMVRDAALTLHRDAQRDNAS